MSGAATGADAMGGVRWSGSHPWAGTEQGRDGAGPLLDSIRIGVYTIPTDTPESDGTFAWEETTLVIVEPRAAGVTGLGYSYTSEVAGSLIADVLAPLLIGRDAFDIARHWSNLVGAVRNIGRQGIAATAISALDNGLWDLKARLLDLSLIDLLGRAREAIPAYGSGGFCTYDDARLTDQLGGWAAAGFHAVKMKIGRDGAADPHRVDVARAAIGDGVGLFVDANGAYDRVRALVAGEWLAERRVTWFEEPVSSDDLPGLRLVRESVPADVAAGEYGYDLQYFERMCAAAAVDCLQVDVTRCGGITGWLRAATIADAHGLEVSAHCAPYLAVAPAAATPNMRHLEWFHDHVRIEQQLFCELPGLEGGDLPVPDGPGNGLRLDEGRAERFRVA
jgi:L-alanine-DL-glutamate epimerase-like enolase superfamily enzyme